MNKPTSYTILRGITSDDEYNQDDEDEARAESMCSMGVGCGTHGVCFAEKNGKPEMCGKRGDTQKKPLSSPPKRADSGRVRGSIT